ncbi:putative zinc-binding protein [Candidatus Latescibacterota bacterium]
MAENNQGCECVSGPTLIFPCSGAADVGEISDQVARKLTRDGAGKMFCLAGLGGHVESFITNTNAAGKIIAIDGCPVDCAKKTLEHADFADFEHIRITDLGCVKGESPAENETVTRITAEINTILLS